jgi:hypothetical protein
MEKRWSGDPASTISLANRSAVGAAAFANYSGRRISDAGRGSVAGGRGQGSQVAGELAPVGAVEDRAEDRGAEGSGMIAVWMISCNCGRCARTT